MAARISVIRVISVLFFLYAVALALGAGEPRPTRYGMTSRREFVGRLIAAGPTRTLSGEAGRYVVTAEAVRRAVDEGLFQGLACFIDHAAGRPSLRRLIGVWHSVVWDAAQGAAVGRLRAYETAATRPVLDLLTQVLEDHEPPDVGVSLVFYPRLAADGRTVTALLMVESADLVMFPASPVCRLLAVGGQ